MADGKILLPGRESGVRDQRGWQFGRRRNGHLLGSARRPRLFCIGDEQNSGYGALVSRAGKSAFNVRMNPEGDVHTVFPHPIGKFGGLGSACLRAGGKNGQLGPGNRPRTGRDHRPGMDNRSAALAVAIGQHGLSSQVCALKYRLPHSLRGQTRRLWRDTDDQSDRVVDTSLGYPEGADRPPPTVYL